MNQNVPPAIAYRRKLVHIFSEMIKTNNQNLRVPRTLDFECTDEQLTNIIYDAMELAIEDAGEHATAKFILELTKPFGDPIDK